MEERVEEIGRQRGREEEESGKAAEKMAGKVAELIRMKGGKTEL